MNSQNFFNYLKKRRNDLQDSAERICPKIREINDFLKLKTKTKLARMTGSEQHASNLWKIQTKP